MTPSRDVPVTALHEQPASAQDMLMETEIDAGNMHALIEAVQAKRNEWREGPERLRGRSARVNPIPRLARPR